MHGHGSGQRLGGSLGRGRLHEPPLAVEHDAVGDASGVLLVEDREGVGAIEGQRHRPTRPTRPTWSARWLVRARRRARAPSSGPSGTWRAPPRCRVRSPPTSRGSRRRRDGFESLEQRGGDALAAMGVVDAELVEEQLDPLVGVDRLDPADEADGLIADERQQQVVALPARKAVVHASVGSVVEQRGAAASTRASSPGCIATISIVGSPSSGHPVAAPARIAWAPAPGTRVRARPNVRGCGNFCTNITLGRGRRGAGRAAAHRRRSASFIGTWGGHTVGLRRGRRGPGRLPRRAGGRAQRDAGLRSRCVVDPRRRHPLPPGLRSG